ncbi:MAG TPA: AraC family transcriptional regulator [Ramlibacter sp.]
MPAAPLHQSRVIASPWPGVYATETASGRHYARHVHGTFGFGTVDAGGQRSASGRGVVDAFAGDIVTTNPGEVHDGRPLGGPQRRWHTVYLEPAVLAAMAGGYGEVAIAQPVLRDPHLRQATRHLVAVLQGWSQGRATALACEEALVGACGLLLARHSTQRGAPAAAAAPIERVRQRLGDDLAGTPSLDELAVLAGIGRFQLLRRFTAVHGCTPHAWLAALRAERARGLIGRGTALADAASTCGFADQSHMTRSFSRQFGFTPGAWQRAQRALQ